MQRANVQEKNESCEFWIARMRGERPDLDLKCEKPWQKDGICRAHGGLCSSKDIKDCLHVKSQVM
jgi:hypothetical protein